MAAAELEWFDHAFGPAYDVLYSHRDEEDAAADVARILDAGVDPHARTLDAACGGGRHLAHLAGDAGFDHLVGVDRSLHLLQKARQRLGGSARLVRGDLRALPFATGAFEVVLNLFTSFGYFADDTEHERAVGELHRVLAPGGRFHLDHIDRARLEAELVPSSAWVAQGVTYTATRRIEAGRVVKHLVSSDGAVDHHESVRLWSPDEMRDLLRGAGFQAVEVVLADGRMHCWSQK